MDEIKEKWSEVKENLRKEYGIIPILYNTWIEPLEYYETKNDIVYIMVKSEQGQPGFDYVSKKYKKFFQTTISIMFNHEYDVDFILEDDIRSTDEIEREKLRNNTIYNINYEKSHLNSKYKFDTFITGGNNQLAYSASVAVAESPGTMYNPLYLYSKPGLGKTHLMHAIGHHILEKKPETKLIYVTSEDFTNEVIDSIKSGDAASMPKLREKYRNVDVLMVDDIQFIIGRRSTQEEFFHTFNALHDSKKQIIISSDKPPKEMKELDERFRSRFGGGLIVDIGAPDYETRMAILKQNQETFHLDIDIEILKYIATNINTNIRELEGALNKIIAASKLMNVPLTLPLAEEALKDVIYPNMPKEITPELILNTVADQFEVKPEDILSHKRPSEIVIPRHVFMYLCKELIDIPYTKIASILNKKDHTTIMHGHDKIKDELKTNADLSNKVDLIIKKINP